MKNRTHRRFYQEHGISMENLRELIDLARLSSSGANMQPLKYVLSNDAVKNEKIFKHLRWAGYLKDWNGPEEGEKPSAYIIVLNDSSISKNCWWDHGIAAQSILLGAVEKGLGGCMFGSIDRAGLAKDINIGDNYEILMVIALGKPKEEVVLEELQPSGDIKYWRDENAVHHVPKRELKEIILDI